MPPPHVRVGDTLRIPEADYCYGYGVLTLRVTAVDATAVQLPALEWVWVRGIEIRWNGAENGERRVLVRVSALGNPPNHDDLARRVDDPPAGPVGGLRRC
jgi:hypothetical protein